MKHRKNKQFLISCFLCLAAMTASAQDAMKVLDETASRIRKSGGVKVTFSATNFSGLDEQGSTNGTMLLQDKKYQLQTTGSTTWYDGETQWCYVSENEEVNVSNPTQKEMQAVNPYAFLDVYKQGYATSVKESSLRGSATYEVHLTAQKEEMDAQEIYIDIRKSDYVPLCIRVRQGKDWSRLALLSFQGGQKFGKDTFTFPKEKYPDAEIIDLR